MSDDAVRELCYEELEMCCQTLCNKQDVWNYIKQLENEIESMRGINRLEVIDDTVHQICVRYLDKDEKVRYTLQDDDKTLKVFIDKVARFDVEGKDK